LSILKQLRPDVPILALTASATPEVLFDISKQLRLKDPEKMVYGFYRPNLYYQVEVCADEAEKRHILRTALRKFNTGRVLVYCGTRKVTEELARELSEEFTGVGYYHAGLTPELRNLAQQKYLDGKSRILVATNAFGMGIDQPDVRLVVHFQMPGNIDSLYQEMGRAGRDLLPSTCLLLYSRKDKGLQSFFIQQSEAPQAIRNSRYRNLDTLVDYSEGSECRHGEILTYYRDQQRIQSCGHCDVCDPYSDRRVIAVREPATERDVALSKERSSSKPKRNKKQAEIKLEGLDLILFEDLRKWRKGRAQELDVPAFVILSDRTLRGIATRRPSSLEELSGVYGIGQAKLEQFGAEVLQVVSEASGTV
jgi:ATP-dependent DNA helicase RecQ